MSQVQIETHSNDASVSPKGPIPSRTRSAIVWSSLFFSVLQSVCTAFMAINGVRFAVGLGALVATAGLGAKIDAFHHITWLRLTLLLFATVGSLLTLEGVLRARRLRNRPSARWRVQPLTPRERRMESVQIAISLLTLVLVFVEEYLHFHAAHSL